MAEDKVHCTADLLSSSVGAMAEASGKFYGMLIPRFSETLQILSPPQNEAIELSTRNMLPQGTTMVDEDGDTAVSLVIGVAAPETEWPVWPSTSFLERWKPPFIYHLHYLWLATANNLKQQKDHSERQHNI
ncbi:hypothetical protein Nepgr_024495 [Nepenthes gracilis]|uniref:Uncharacterized protein n=1 Tax=Nepenthes gracilis TaxID=150966 RepID=A0AAD3T616_NEPGR|nr:hypothetical protein Nepgr_024495 [Nepenthes gracilis]